MALAGASGEMTAAFSKSFARLQGRPFALAAVHASQVSRIKLNTLSDIFVVGDLVTAHVLETSDNRLSFSILEEIGFSISARFHKDDYTYAKLLAQKENLDIWVTCESSGCS